jgi:hypothetical protein
MTVTEFTHSTEQAAHAVRRSLIDQGRKVSLVAFDPSRNLYVFDLYV